MLQSPHVRFNLPADFMLTIFRGEMRQGQNDGSYKEGDPPLLLSKLENFWFAQDCLTWCLERNLWVCRISETETNILDEQLELPTKPITCLRKRWTCGFDIMCTKTNT